MKITVERDDGSEEVFQGVTDYYIAVRHLEHLGVGEGLAGEYQTRSYSRHAGGLRDVVKELRQSIVELDRIMSKEP